MLNELASLLNLISQGVTLGTTTFKQGTTLAIALLVGVVTKFLFVVVIAVIAYKIAKVWLARIYPDKGKFALARDSVFTTIALLVGFAAWRIF